jgi:hypothetical protein
MSKGIIDLKDVDGDLKSHIENLEGKGIRQQIEEAKYKSYDGVLTEEMLMDFLNDLNAIKPYKDPTEDMSEDMAIAFNEAMKEYVKNNY